MTVWLLAIERSRVRLAVVSLSRDLLCANDSHIRACVTKQYNLVLVKGR